MKNSDKSFIYESILIYAKLLKFVYPYWGFFLISILGFLIYGSGQPATAWIFKHFIDGIIEPDLAVIFGLPLQWTFPSLIVLVAVYQGVGSFLGNYFIAKLTRNLIHDLRVMLFGHLIRLPTAYYDQHKLGFLISRVTHNVNQVTSAATDSLKIIFRDGLTVIALLVYLVWMNWKLTLVLIATLPIIGLITNRSSKKFRMLSKRSQDAMGGVAHVVSEAVTAHKVIKSFDGASYECEKFKKTSLESNKHMMKLTRTSAILTPLLQLVTYSALAIVMYLVLYFRGNASPGEIVAYVTAACLIPKPIRQLSEVSVTVQRGLAAAENLFKFMEVSSEADQGEVVKDQVQGRLEVKALDFSYPKSKHQALRNISFVIEPGQTVALVGRSGSGKSTLASLIPRFYDYSQGEILLDGISIKDYRLQNLRQHISLVTQHVTLFDDTIANNIIYGSHHKEQRNNLQEVAEKAYVMEFAQRLPNGLDTQVGMNGVLLSGGQCQRISIARALLKNAPVLILDEATSALDLESERLIQAALEKMMLNRTTLVIAHRLSTVQKADVILVMDNGEIIERGTHAGLLQLNGAYARLYASASEGYLSDE